MKNNGQVVVISGKSLCKNKIYNVSTQLKPSENTLIKGSVNNPDGTPANGACVEVVELSDVEVIRGYVFTNECGDFAFSMKCKPSVNYKLNVYGSLN